MGTTLLAKQAGEKVIYRCNENLHLTNHSLTVCTYSVTVRTYSLTVHVNHYVSSLSTY